MSHKDRMPLPSMHVEAQRVRHGVAIVSPQTCAFIIESEAQRASGNGCFDSGLQWRPHTCHCGEAACSHGRTCLCAPGGPCLRKRARAS